jgi:type III pantothenate kinase
MKVGAFFIKTSSIMNAVIDIGNTFGKLAFFDGLQLKSFERGKVKTLLKSLNKVNLEKIIICSVTKSKKELEALFSEFPLKHILTKNSLLPIRNDYGTPETLGYDRIAAAVAAFYEFPSENCLILDMGTAIKYDFLSSDGSFKGGIISPGMKMRFKALHTFTKKLPLIEKDGIPSLIGDSTKTCIQSGVINGIATELNGIITRYRAKGDLKIILSGGDADFFESQINYPTFTAPNLVLEGLNRILIHNVENKNFTK